MGASKIIIGSKAFEDDQINHGFLKTLNSILGRERIIIAIDAFEGEIVTQAWKHRTGLNVFDVVEKLEKFASEFLYTCVEKEGGLQGTDLPRIQKLSQSTTNELTVAGGVTSMEEIRYPADLGADVQLGMALYTGKIKLDDAFIESLQWKSNLIPAITCDTSGQLLMLAYSKKEIEQQLSKLTTADIARRSLDANGLIIPVNRIEGAIVIANKKAPEHLGLYVENAQAYVDSLKNYGSLFIGPFSAKALGDYNSGLNHTLLTNTGARYI